METSVSTLDLPSMASAAVPSESPSLGTPSEPRLGADQFVGTPLSETVVRRFDPPQGPHQLDVEDTSPAHRASDDTLAWHERLLAADRLLKEHGRPIVLAALLAASGLLLLVLNSGRTPSQADQPPAQPSAHTQPADLQPLEGEFGKASGGAEALELTPPAGALGPQGLASRRDLATREADPEITPIGPHFEARPLANPSELNDRPQLPYPSTAMPAWQNSQDGNSEEDPSNVATLGAVRPTR